MTQVFLFGHKLKEIIIDNTTVLKPFHCNTMLAIPLPSTPITVDVLPAGRSRQDQMSVGGNFFFKLFTIPFHLNPAPDTVLRESNPNSLQNTLMSGLVKIIELVKEIKR